MVCGGHLNNSFGQSTTQAGHPAGRGGKGGGASNTPEPFVQSHPGSGQAVAMSQGGQTGRKVAS